jgi:hypothetical protein
MSIPRLMIDVARVAKLVLSSAGKIGEYRTNPITLLSTSALNAHYFNVIFPVAW